MEIITFDHKVYQDLSEKIERIADYVFKKETLPQQTPEIWLTSEELADLLKISTRTLQRMRKERVIPLHDATQQMPLSPLRRRGVHRPPYRYLRSADIGGVSQELLSHP